MHSIAYVRAPFWGFAVTIGRAKAPLAETMTNSRRQHPIDTGDLQEKGRRYNNSQIPTVLPAFNKRVKRHPQCKNQPARVRRRSTGTVRSCVPPRNGVAPVSALTAIKLATNFHL